MDYSKLLIIILIIILLPIMGYASFEAYSKITGAITEKTVTEEWNNIYVPKMSILSNDLDLILEDFNDIDYFLEVDYFENRLIPKLEELEKTLSDSENFLLGNQDFFEESYFNYTITDLQNKIKAVKIIKDSSNLFLNERNKTINYYDNLYNFT